MLKFNKTIIIELICLSKLTRRSDNLHYKFAMKINKKHWYHIIGACFYCCKYCYILFFLQLPSNRVTSDGRVTSDKSYYFILRLKYRKRNYNLKNCYVVTINLFLLYNFNTLAISIDNWFKQQEGDLSAAQNKKSVGFCKFC